MYCPKCGSKMKRKNEDGHHVHTCPNHGKYTNTGIQVDFDYPRMPKCMRTSSGYDWGKSKGPSGTRVLWEDENGDKWFFYQNTWYYAEVNENPRYAGEEIEYRPAKDVLSLR